MLEEKKQIEKMVKSLWQGKGVDIVMLSQLLDEMTSKMINAIDEWNKKGIDFPVQYILETMKHTTESIQKKDDYRLADCLMYEWLEIIDVYEEVAMECK